jgi:hypothetical protein
MCKYFNFLALRPQNSAISPGVMSRMQLQAAVSLLHLSTVEVYANAIAPKFVDLAITVQVSSAAYMSYSRLTLVLC